MRPFQPLFRSPHLQTIAGHLWPRDGGERRFPPRAQLYRTEPDVQVMVTTQEPAGTPRGDILMVHGLEGSGESGYMRSLSGAALQRGFATHRFHMRTCGGTGHLCRTLYHAGLTGDLLAVLREFAAQGRPPAIVVGFSLGGNVVLKLAGELGEEAARWMRGVCSVSAPLDLAACARRMTLPDNRLYQLRFVRAMKRRLRASGRYQPADYAGLDSVFAIDDRITAPSFGFGTAKRYYETQSCNQFLAGIRVPGLLITAQDDTFVPFAAYDNPAIHANPHLRLIATEYGGHMGFLSRGRPRFWLDETILEWAAGLL